MTDQCSGYDASEENYAYRPGEREQLEREIAEREARLRAAENVAWARARQAAREAGRRATKDYAPVRRAPPPPTPAPAAVGEAWKRYVSTRIAAASQVSMRAIARGIAQSVGKDIIALEKRCEKLEAELAELRAEAKLQATLGGIAERLGKLEASPPKPSAPRALPSTFDKGSSLLA